MSAVNFLELKAKFFVWLMLIFADISLPLKAQTYFFDNYSIRQGLSEQKVYKLFQDSKDYIWLGTANGLSRFDGKKFENFTSRNNLASGGVRSIFEDSLGYIWFGHLNGGISRYDGQKFERIAFDSLQLSGDVTGIVQVNNKIWFTCQYDGAIQAGFPVDDIKHIRARQFRGKAGLSDQVFGLKVIRDGSFICVADVGLRKYNTESNKFENYRMPHMTTYFSTTCLLEDRYKNLWFGTYKGGIYKYVMSESKMVFYDLVKEGISSNTVSCLFEDSQDRIWAGTWGGGIALFDKDKLIKIDKSNGLNATNIYDIIEDAESNILISDQDNGLTIFKGEAFKTINERDILPDPNVNAIYQDLNGTMWFGTNTGISLYHPPESRKPVYYSKKISSLSENVRFFKEDKERNLWIGLNKDGVIRYNLKTSKYEPQPYIDSVLYGDGQVKAMEIDKQNNLWIGTVDGLVVGTINVRNFHRYNVLDSLTVSAITSGKQNIKRYSGQDSLTVHSITSLYCDTYGNMWIGTERNDEKPCLIKYDAAKEEFKQASIQPGIIPKTMVMDTRGVLWIGTGEGLVSLRNDSLTSTLTQDDGLLSNNINLLEKGDDGSIYVGTNLGLNKYFPGEKRFFSYTEKNGFTGIETKPNAVYRCSSSELWFGTVNGAIKLDPGKISKSDMEPLTHILSMQANYHNRIMSPGLTLKYNDANPILFDYYSICLTNPDIVRYRVKLDGADLDWLPVTDQTRAIYSALTPGKYTFNVIACNSQGVWNKDPVSFHFIIKPPFYQTWLFIILVTVTIAVLIVMYIKIRERNLVKEKLILEKRVSERTAEVVQKSMEIEEKNRDITASIRYAERIQRAMLPKEDTFDETFVLFMPKDIVSGDFYWMYDNGDWQFIAAVDCTGHGVPGAFMSIIGHNSLNKIVREYGLTRPSAIVDQLNIEVMKALMQRHEKAITDGMDLALIAFNKRNFTLEFSGAFNPLYVVRKGEVFLYRGDRCQIGMTSVDEKKSFTNQSVDIQPGDMLYMCSDGYADQFGSSDVKKYKSANVKKLLSEIWNLPMNDQRERLKKEILDWKGDLEQVDDILFIGTKIPGN
jgi:ligand-binding sensor domain-containing protein/serine phosphatase RsbU (regulator of sigma subunit)